MLLLIPETGRSIGTVMNILNDTLNGIAVPVIAIGDDLRVIAANKLAKDIFPNLTPGARADKAISRKKGFLRALKQAHDTQTETSVIVKIKEGFGHEFRTTIRPATLDSHPAPMLIVTFLDQSPLKDVKAMRSEFVANVSHEIRSPLTAISGFVETLLGAAKDDPEARTHFLNLMAHEAERMTNLVTDLLSLSQVEVKKRRAPKKSVDPNQIIAQAVASVSDLTRKRNKTLDVKIDGTLPNMLGQYDDLVRVLINLLENALNYSREGATVLLTANVEPANNPLGKPALSISVRDQGDGIPADDIPRLTERFYRVEKSRSRNVGGTGLGLAIVKHILVRHRGLLLIDSVLGEGSTFRILLPLNPAPDNKS